MVDCLIMANWGFLTSYARVLMCIAHDPVTRLRDISARLDIAVRLGITERSAHGIITDLTAAGLPRQAEGRPPQPLPDPGAPAPARTRQPGTHRRRSPGPPHRQRPARHRTAPGK